MVVKSYSKWIEIYFQLTPKGLKEMTLRKKVIRATIMGRFKVNEVSILNYFSKHKTAPRSLAQIWSGIEFGITRNAMLRGINSLKRKGYIKRV